MSIKITLYCDNCIIKHSPTCIKIRNKIRCYKWRHKNLKAYSQGVHSWFKRNKDKKRVYDKKRRSPPLEKLRTRIYNILWRAITSKTKDITQAEHILGCSIQEFKLHIEKQFKSGMTWENYGHGHDKWSFDHIIPTSSAKSKEELYILFHYSNVQPLWLLDNMSKGKK